MLVYQLLPLLGRYIDLTTQQDAAFDFVRLKLLEVVILDFILSGSYLFSHVPAVKLFIFVHFEIETGREL